MLAGIFPPLPTPFNSDESFSPSLQKSLIEKLLPDVDGFLILGSNGEAVYLDEEERAVVLENARKIIPKNKIMIAGTGGEATRTVIKRTQEAAKIGADYALVVAPHYFKGLMNEEVLYKHYISVADNSPIPVLLYNVPAATTIALSPKLIGRLAKHENIVGIKDSSGNIIALTEIMRLTPKDFIVISGNASSFLAAIAMGAKGGILAVANIAPTQYKSIITLTQAGKLQEAQELQTSLNPLALCVTSKYGVPGLKAALGLLDNSAGVCRKPLLMPDEKVVDEIRQTIQVLKYF